MPTQSKPPFLRGVTKMGVTLGRFETEFAEPDTNSQLLDSISARLNSNQPKVELPGNDRLLSAYATDLAEILKDHGIYQRGGLAFILNRQQDGLELITPQMLRTLVEEHL